MARYIDIEGAGIGKANREKFLVPEFADGWNAVLKILDKEPTADVVEVCRCKDCGYSEKMNSLYCNYFNKNVDEDDFCSQGG